MSPMSPNVPEMSDTTKPGVNSEMSEKESYVRILGQISLYLIKKSYKTTFRERVLSVLLNRRFFTVSRFAGRAPLGVAPQCSPSSVFYGKGDFYGKVR